MSSVTMSTVLYTSIVHSYSVHPQYEDSGISMDPCFGQMIRYDVSDLLVCYNPIRTTISDAVQLLIEIPYKAPYGNYAYPIYSILLDPIAATN